MTSKLRYHVMRQDDHGHTSIVGGDANPACYHSPEAAECQRITLDRQGHKQTYWVEPTSTCACPTKE